MADVTQLRFAQLLKRAFGVKATDPGRTLMPGVVAVHEIADSYQPENRASRGEKLFGITNNAGNVAATSIANQQLVNPVGSNRICVIKRATWSLNLPTAANQPGNCAFLIFRPAAQSTPPTIPLQPKDFRFALGGVLTNFASGLLVGAQGAVGFSNQLYAAQVFPGAAAVPTIHQVDNLDIPVPPGVGVSFFFSSDALPVATYTWTLALEGYERTADPNELNTPAS